MKPDGVIAFHVTNRYLDLVPVVEGIAHELDLHTLWIERRRRAAARQFVELGARRQGSGAPERPAPRGSGDATISARRDWRVWTDDFNNLVQVLK